MKTLHFFLALAFILSNVKANSQSIYIGNDLVIDSTVYLYVSGNITTVSNARLINNGTLQLNGNISSQIPDMDEGTGTLELKGSGYQIIDGVEPLVVHNIIFNNTSAIDSNIVLKTPLQIGGMATFTDGIVKSKSNSIIFNAGSSSSAASDISHINGKVEKIGNTAFTFPVGDSIKIRTAGIAAPATVNDVFTCKYFHASPMPICSLLISGGGIHHVSDFEYWTIERTSGTSFPLVTLSFDSSYSGEVTYLQDLIVAYVDTAINRWKSAEGNTTGNLATGSVTAILPSINFGTFTLGSSTNLNPLPVKLVKFDAIYKAEYNVVDLSWVTASELNTKSFEVLRSNDGENWSSIAVVEAMGNSSNLLNYQAKDRNPKPGMNYYKLKSLDLDGSFYYSNIIAIQTKISEAQIIVFPVPAKDHLNIFFKTSRNCKYTIEMYSALGELVQLLNTEINQGESIIEFDMKNYQIGTYMLKISSPDNAKVSYQKIIKIN